MPIIKHAMFLTKIGYMYYFVIDNKKIFIVFFIILII